ncbi:hypothetical protein B0H16DRAFT_1463849 [Mycena metata]|uniref:Uncharacterized protein n=1 Tax=Mycena metata TaxID=1033252 RepID=A0AAD7IHF6_9AGAR|nr:hypothetical protein B0H16DRAFT_1463849 [Mycena metata]
METQVPAPDSAASAASAASAPSAPDPEADAAQRVTEWLNAENIDTSSKKRKAAAVEDSDNTASYRDYSRTYLRIGNSFTSINEIVQHGIFVETTEDIDLQAMSEGERALHDRMTESWELLWRLMGPSFCDDMILLAKKCRLRRKVCAEITTGLCGSRGEDANTFKNKIGLYIMEDPQATLDPPINPSSKIERSLNHPPDTVYNKDDVEAGICEGHLLFTCKGLACALKAPGTRHGNRGNTAKMHVHRFTPRLLSYIVFQTYFALSSLESWEEVDNKFDYKQFYWNIISLFDGGRNTHILELFNYHVFGDKLGRVDKGEQDSEEEEEDDMALIKAKRARLVLVN